jgi:uncharacterized protein
MSRMHGKRKGPCPICQKRETYTMCAPCSRASDFRIAPSTVPGAGLGLYTKISRQKGKLLLRYSGSVRPLEEFLALSDRSTSMRYGLRIGKKVIDARHSHSCLARFINTPKGLSSPIYNCKFAGVSVVAVRNIPAGSELFVGYGRSYWQRRSR